MGTQLLTEKRGRPKLMLSDEERKLRRRLMHNEAQRWSHKKMIRTEKNKKEKGRSAKESAG